jgi:hypothetical protein
MEKHHMRVCMGLTGVSRKLRSGHEVNQEKGKSTNNTNEKRLF